MHKLFLRPLTFMNKYEMHNQLNKRRGKECFMNLKIDILRLCMHNFFVFNSLKVENIQLKNTDKVV